jgi:phosphohistidine phosphatase SixA
MQMPALVSVVRSLAIALAIVIAIGGGALAQFLSSPELVAALKQGGYVIVMRHATSPATRADAATAAPGNTRLERQLNENGHKTARAMGEALRTLRIQIGTVLSSPTFRTRETVAHLAVGTPATFNELGDGSQGYEVSSFKAGTAFMQAKAAEIPPAGTNTLIVTHVPNIEAAFEGTTIDEGEAIIVRPDGRWGTPIGRITIDQWPRLAAQR